ncbi:hypothetical protein FOTG_17803 [Fusarium oxysporum f. sp. vasinfectum 25433]|uniref:Uncharacterized protein n=1 Tax=Fusarium oxysporum f. sp. vasinfectum 25433 TaxID=1089449 RepID=X0KJE3_FUSOX|nr:hypothetical protein FOTG_17803 [Fusarium oxysporum f. sp. vasinfectum 25433]
MLDKGQNINTGSRSILPLHIDMQQSRDELHIHQLKGLDTSPTQNLRELIRLQTTAISALEKSTRLLAESIVLLQNHTQEAQNNPTALTHQEAMHDDDLKTADAIHSNTVARISSAAYACNLENITVGKESQQTIILEGGGSIRARNITTGDGSVQLIGQLSNITSENIVRS